MNLSLYSLRQKGNLVYEYNPFYNYQTSVNLYKVSTDVGDLLCPEEMAVNPKNGLILKQSNGNWVDSRNNIISSVIEPNKDLDLYATTGSLIDLDTDQLNFSLDHPVDITILPSYDGSVNLILNDGYNIPRLINSRFSVRQKNTYEIVDRIGENDTNIYNSETFDKDTSLYFLCDTNPQVRYLGFVGGRLQVGLYCFYFTYCDADDNESDYIAESGLIPVFIGTDGDASSMDGGIKNLETNKGIKLKLSNLDNSYNYLKVYYVRYFADYLLNRVYECKKIYRRFPINSNTVYIQITGNEDAEDLDPNILNITKFNPKNVLALALCKNMLFFGNIVKNSDNYRELSDLALRIYPTVIEHNYLDVDLNSYYGDSYYNSKNMYNNVGYFPGEYYRFGVVFIYLNGTLSNVYNTLGYESESEPVLPDLFTETGDYLTRNYLKIDSEGWVKDINNITFVNSRGVFKIGKSLNKNKIYGIRFNFLEGVQKYLKENLGIRGCFFVRQKRVPTLLALCYLLPMDEQLKAPVLEYKNGNNLEYATECFITQEGLEVNNTYEDRLYKYKNIKNLTLDIAEDIASQIPGDSTELNTELQEVSDYESISKKAYAGICPDFLLNLPYFNQIFNGSSFRISKVSTNSHLIKNDRFYEENPGYNYSNTNNLSQVKICTVTEDVPTVAINDQTYKLEIGETEEAFRFEYAQYDNGVYDAGNEDWDKINGAPNVVRGKYSPYLAIYSENKLETGVLYNIYLDNSINSKQEYLNRMNSSEPFYAIGDRYNFNDIINNQVECWRGDCFHNQFTYRLNRNFNDPSLPNNDKIIDKDTWKDNYKAQSPEEWDNISRSDLNAVLMGSWITFNLLSSENYALRSNDHSYVAEEALMGSPRSFYPRSMLLFRGENKMPDSYLYNDAYRATLGYKCYFTLLDMNYVKDTFTNRIQYSAMSILDSFKNNFRYSLSTYFRDYSQEYGGIMKLVGFEGYLLVVFEHAIGIAVINERILAGNGDGEPVFINTKNVLPEELTIISDTYGTQWPESVIKSEAGYVYGVDTVNKKIWRVKGQLIEILSDFKVNKFLIDNISLGERELYPTIGLKNVKTHYNNHKKDIMFTFYDDIYLDEEKVWNLCYNELLEEFVTFYSWVPSYSENIDTQYFSFNRQTSKLLTLLNKCNYNIYDNTGVLLDIPLLKDDKATLHYVLPEKTYITKLSSDSSTISPDKEIPGEYKKGRYEVKSTETELIKFELAHDHWGNWKLFEPISNSTLELKNDPSKDLVKAQKGVLLLYIRPYIEKFNQSTDETYTRTNFDTLVIAVSKEKWIKDYCKEDFYLHGHSGIFDVEEDLVPCFWYDEPHPFEFEFVVNDKIGLLKIFNNLILISNKAEPESFHFEIEGDNYDFSNDKRTMYFRLEATKELYLNLGSDIIFNRYYTDVKSDKYTQEQHYRAKDSSYSSYTTNNKFNWDKAYPIEKVNLVLQVKSTIFPLYYERVDKYNDIYHSYAEMTGNKYDFKNLSGSEITWNRDLNQFNIVTHIKNSPIPLVGRLRGNSYYKEGKWNVQIPSITFMLKNENPWSNNIPPIVINSSYIPKDLTSTEISADKIPNIYTRTKTSPITNYIKVGDWTYRKETKIRDKWIKIRVRYSGKNLAIIHSLITLYTISYA